MQNYNSLSYIVFAIVIILILWFFYQKHQYKNTKQEETNIDENINEDIQSESNGENSDESNNESNKNIKKIIGEKKLRKIIKRKKEKIRIKEPEPKEDLVFMDIGINNKHIGRIIILLFSDVVPKTCDNFRVLCQNTNKLSYRGSPFHRIINDFMIQGGDFTRENGTGGMSIYGNKFADENFDIPHSEPYLLSMANSGPNTNGSQFFITTNETPHLDGKHVVFGRVVEGTDLIDKLNEVETEPSDKPIDDIRILNCGSA